MRVSAATVQSVIRDAVRASATAIHFEPQQKHVRVAYRIDGRLVEGILLPAKLGLQLITYIKKLANLQSETALPQEARFRLIIDNQPLTLRISTLPLIEHEKLVIHIVNMAQPVSTLAELGLWGPNAVALKNVLETPRGLVITSGPNGSGTTTTLYSLLTTLQKPEIVMSTIEDTVTRPLEKIPQTSIRPKYGLTYATGLKAALRQDANIIMVDNTVDRETLEVIMEGAISGRLLLTNIPASSSTKALERLLDFGIEPFLVSTALKAATSQRLIRTLCPSCKIAYKPEKHEVLTLLHACMRKNRSSLGHLRTLEQQAAHEGIGDDIGKSYSIKNNNITKLWRAKISGCNACHHTGYKGQTGIFEIMPVSASLQSLLMHKASPSIIQSKAIEEGMISLQTDGLIKALRGLTSAEELLTALSGY